jgi:putative SOS response-associated peptidase YedK
MMESISIGIVDPSYVKCHIHVMCGRFALTATPEELMELFGLLESDDFPVRFNIAPTQPIIVVVAADRAGPGSNLPERKALLVRWGFTPGWVKDPRDFPLLINARAETAIEKASFRAAMRHRRVLVPASGFYEWHRPAKGSGEASQAYWIAGLLDPSSKRGHRRLCRPDGDLVFRRWLRSRHCCSAHHQRQSRDCPHT